MSAKKNGAYCTITGTVKKIDEFQRLFVLTDRTEIPVDEIVEISGGFLAAPDDETADRIQCKIDAKVKLKGAEKELSAAKAEYEKLRKAMGFEE